MNSFFTLIRNPEAGSHAGCWTKSASPTGQPEFWFGEHAEQHNPMHIAFVAESRAQVDAFYEAALAAGGKANGPPGIRAIYHPDYYGAFMLDLNGHNTEAVCQAAET